MMSFAFTALRQTCIRNASISRPVATMLSARRNMFIEAHPTPNNNSLKFHPARPVYDKGSKDFPSVKTAAASPLAEALFKIDGVSGVFFGLDFITVTKKDDNIPWSDLKPKISSAIMDFYSSGAPIVLPEADIAQEQASAEDSEVVVFIKELLDTKIRPSVQDDGGDIRYVSFDEASGVVVVKLQGACSTCSSSKATLKQGVENMLMHYVPEVKEVVALDEETEDPNDPVVRAQHEFEEKLSQAHLVSASQQQHQQQQQQQQQGEEERKKVSQASSAAGGGAAQGAGGGGGKKASPEGPSSASEREERARRLLADSGV